MRDDVGTRAAAELRRMSFETGRHTTGYIEAGPKDGPLMIFMHGHPELAIYWRRQLEVFALMGWCCVAPDMRGYGRSTVHRDAAAYAGEEIVRDMTDLHDALGGAPAVWVGHDWGSAICWSIGSHHPERCRGLVNMNIPYLREGLVLPRLVELVDRRIYPESRYPVGQWDYWLFHRQNFERSAEQLARDTRATISAIYQRSSSEGVDRPSWLSDLRGQGGWFGNKGAPAVQADRSMLCEEDYEEFAAAFEANGFAGPNAWYLHDAENGIFAQKAKAGGLIDVPCLFLHGAWDTVCRTVEGHLAEPMRRDCRDLEEAVVQGGHFFSLEQPEETNRLVADWLARHGLGASAGNVGAASR